MKNILPIIVIIVVLLSLAFMLYAHFKVANVPPQYPNGSPVAADFITSNILFGDGVDPAEAVIYGCSMGSNPLQFSDPDKDGEIIVQWTLINIKSGPKKGVILSRKHLEEMGDKNTVIKYMGDVRSISCTGTDNIVWTVDISDPTECENDPSYPRTSIKMTRLRSCDKSNLDYDCFPLSIKCI